MSSCRISPALLVLACALVLLGPAVRAATYYVNDGSTGEAGSMCTAVGNNSNDGQTPSTPKRDIQNLLDAYPAMGTGDTLWADPGTYAENIQIGSGHSGLALQGAGAGVSVIDGGAAASCIRLDGFASGEISGFTIQNGHASGIILQDSGGGISCRSASSPTIQDNTISGNWADSYGGGICCWSASSPTVQDNTITGNTGHYGGGGIFCDQSSPMIAGNTISGNSAGNYGGGGGIHCSDSSPTIRDNTISGNDVAPGTGGGIYCYGSSPTIQNNAISGNYAEYYGGGIGCFHGASPTIQNNTISGNKVDYNGGGMYCCDDSAPVLSNTILWGNSAASAGNQISVRSVTQPSSLTVSYSDVEGGQGAAHVEAGCTLTWGLGNINSNPLFADDGHWDGDVWVQGDYHVKSETGRYDPGSETYVVDTVTSPAIDAADPADPYANEPAPNGGRVNMGAYGNTDQASKSLSYPCPMAHGVVSTGADWTWVTFPESFTNPVVVAGPASKNDAEPGVIRLRYVGPNGFAIRFQEWDYLDGSHPAEKIAWVAIEAGNYDLGGGNRLVAGKLWTNKTNPNAPRKVMFPQPFGGWPVVLCQVQTNQGPSAVTDRIVKTFAGMFAFVMQEEEAGGTHGGEQIGYIAVSQGVTDIGGVTCEAKRSWTKLKHPPVWVGTALGGTQVFVEEEQSADTETEHWIAEYGGFLGLGAQPPYVADLQTCWVAATSQDTSVLRCAGAMATALYGRADP